MVEPYWYVWLVWASAFLAVWALLYARFPRQRRANLYTTTPFSLAEPLFVPAYWNPPSLFDLAQRTGFDLESLIFCFAIGGVGSVLCNIVTGARLEAVSAAQRRHHRCWHRAALLTPLVPLPVLLPFPCNPIHPAMLMLAAGASAAYGLALCGSRCARPGGSPALGGCEEGWTCA